jgi:uracil-DNA glycosylase
MGGEPARIRVVFVSSNPGIGTVSQGQPPSTAEAYPVAAWPDDKIVEFLGRRFDQSVSPRPFARDFRHLQRDGHYSHKSTRFWLSVQRRAEELLGDEADPSRNYVMTEVVHCKSKGETGVTLAAETCARRYLDDIVSLTAAPIVVVVGKQAHLGLHEHPPHLPEPPYLCTAELGGRPRELVFIWHPAAFQGPKTIGGLHGSESMARLKELAAFS